MRRIVAVLALTAASTSAFAQSADYRRGYDEGYAAGQRDSRGDRGDRGDRGRRMGCPHRAGRLRQRRGMCNARRAVRDMVERGDNTIPVGNQLCGDPAVSTQKRLAVVYRCGNSQPVRASASEGETLRLGCRR